MKRRIKRSGFHLKQFFGCPLDVFGDCVAMHRSRLKGSQYKEVERSLKKFNSCWPLDCHCVDTLLNIA
jgi:hypothetical protein